MDLEEFRQHFLNEAAAWAESDRNFRHASFVDVAARYLEEAGEVADFEACYFRGIGRQRRSLAIDGFAFDEADGSLRIFMAEPSTETPTPTLTGSRARALLGRLRALAEDALSDEFASAVDPSTPVFGFSNLLRGRIKEVTRIRTYLLTSARLSERAGDWSESQLRGIPVESHIWDVGRFFRVHSARSGRDDLLVDFTARVPGGLPCLEASEGDNYSSYLCVVPGTVLADIYDEYGSRLLEGNVRSFLTVRGRVNKGIRNTVLHEAPMFFAYNNGIAATASQVSLDKTGIGARLQTATDLQIVNGGQTTASLAAARRQDKASLDDVFVPMKLSVVPPEQSGELIPLISRYANSQNRVSDADFFSNHEFHRRLEQISRRLWAPSLPGAQHETHWFYERARGQYVNEMSSLTSSERRRFQQIVPRNQVVTKTDLAKSENAWRRLPHLVSRGAQKNFLEFATFVSHAWEHDPDQFHEDYFRGAMARVVLFRSTERIVSSQDWYSGGYRANVVAYAVSRLSQLIEQAAPGFELDTLKIWQRQQLSAALSTQLAEIAHAMHLVITDTPAGVQNVTEWSKKEGCWDRAVAAEIAWYPETMDALCEAAELLESARDAKVQQRQDSGIDAQTAVVVLGRSYWADLKEWAEMRMLLPPEEEFAVRLAAGIVEGVPSDRQSKNLLELKSRLELEGFPPPAKLNLTT